MDKFLDANYKGGPLTPPTGMEQGLIGRENEVLMDYLTRAQGGKRGGAQAGQGGQSQLTAPYGNDMRVFGEGLSVPKEIALGPTPYSGDSRAPSLSGLDLGSSAPPGLSQSGGGGYESLLAEARNIALGGENLPPGLQGRINDLLTQGENRARAQFGTGFESTTGGQEILKGYRRSADELREGFANTRGTLLTNIASTGQNMQSQSLLDTYRALSASDAFRRTLQTERQTGDAAARTDALQKALIEATNNSGKASLLGTVLGGGKGSLGGSVLGPIGSAVGSGIVKGAGSLWDWVTGGGGKDVSGPIMDDFGPVGNEAGPIADEFGEAMLPTSGGPEETSLLMSGGGGEDFVAGSNVVWDNPAIGTGAGASAFAPLGGYEAAVTAGETALGASAAGGALGAGASAAEMGTLASLGGMAGLGLTAGGAALIGGLILNKKMNTVRATPQEAGAANADKWAQFARDMMGWQVYAQPQGTGANLTFTFTGPDANKLQALFDQYGGNPDEAFQAFMRIGPSASYLEERNAMMGGTG